MKSKSFAITVTVLGFVVLTGTASFGQVVNTIQINDGTGNPQDATGATIDAIGGGATFLTTLPAELTVSGTGTSAMAGLLNVAQRMRAQGGATFGSGEGLEFGYNSGGGYGLISAYDWEGPARKDLRIYGFDQTFYTGASDVLAFDLDSNGVATHSQAVKIKEGTAATPAPDNRVLEMRFVPGVTYTPTPTPDGPTPTPSPTGTATPAPPPYAMIESLDRTTANTPLHRLSLTGRRLEFVTGNSLDGSLNPAKEWMRINPNGSIIVNPTGYEGSSSALEAGPGQLFKMNMSLWLEDGEVRQIVNSENSTLQKPAGGDGLPDQYAPLFIGYRRLPSNDRPLPGDVLARFAGAGLDGQISGCGSAGGFDAACGSSWGGYMQFVLEPFLPLDTPVPHAAGTMPSRFELYLTPHNSDTPALAMTVKNGGRVGIGTASPDYKLDVDGIIRASGALKTGTTFDSTGSSYNDGSVIFVATSEEVTGLQVTGLREDGNNFFWDNSNKRLGLAFGGASPTLSNTLDVHGTVAIGAGYAGASAAPGNGLIVQGTVGIGTDEPDDENFILEVNGNTNITGDLIVGGEIIGGGGGCDECEFVLDGENVTGILPLAKGGTNKNGYVS